jgi:hypothetical protein
MKEHIGLGAKRTIKDTVAGMMVVAKALRGEALDVPKKRKAPVRKSVKNIMAEKELELQIILRLMQKGFVVYKTGMPGAHDYNCKHNPVGIADLLVFGLPNKIVMIEVKVPTKRYVKNGGLTGKQPEFRDLMGKMGIKYVIAYSVTDALDAVC